MNENKIVGFLKSIILDTDAVSYNHREKALQMYVECLGGKKDTVSLTIYGTRVTVELSRGDYAHIGDLKASSIIEAIKELRKVGAAHGFSVGLKEAKDTVDNWDYNL